MVWSISGSSGSSYPNPEQIWKVTLVGKTCNSFQKLTFANEGLDAAEYLWRRTTLAKNFAMSWQRFPDFLNLYFRARRTLF